MCNITHNSERDMAYIRLLYKFFTDSKSCWTGVGCEHPALFVVSNKFIICTYLLYKHTSLASPMGLQILHQLLVTFNWHAHADRLPSLSYLGMCKFVVKY